MQCIHCLLNSTWWVFDWVRHMLWQFGFSGYGLSLIIQPIVESWTRFFKGKRRTVHQFVPLQAPKRTLNCCAYNETSEWDSMRGTRPVPLRPFSRWLNLPANIEPLLPFLFFGYSLILGTWQYSTLKSNNYLFSCSYAVPTLWGFG